MTHPRTYNPYAWVYWREWRVQRRLNGWAVQLVVYVLGVGVATALLRPVLLGFLDQPPAVWGQGTSELVLRMGLVVVGLAGIDVYGALVRSPDRSLLRIHPVHPGQVALAALGRVAVARVPVVLALVAVLTPVGLWGAWSLAAVAAVAVVGLSAFGQALAAVVHLGAIAAAEHPRFAGLLDLVRGANPRSQAALIYAPGVALLLAAGVVVQASAHLERAAAGEWLSLGWIVLPWVLIGPLMVALPRMARHSWFGASAVLADIDARYGTLEQADDNLVYLDWVVRWLPQAVRPYARRDLRYGWRARRMGVLGLWGLGLLAALAGWTTDPTGPARAGVVSLGAVAVGGVLGVLLHRDEPEVLRVWLPSGGLPAFGARALVLGLWLQGGVLLAVASVWVRAGLGAAATLALVTQGVVAAVVCLAPACARLRTGALLVYAVGAVVVAGIGASYLVS